MVEFSFVLSRNEDGLTLSKVVHTLYAYIWKFFITIN